MKLKSIRALFASLLLAAGASSAMAGVGCVGKMWNPLVDLDFKLIGGLKVAGMSMMEVPSELGEPPQHNVPSGCFCVDGLKTGFGLGMTFWMPSYINDMARKSGCVGFLNGLDMLPGFVSLSSGQEYSMHAQGKEGVTGMQVHWAYADVTAIAGKNLFEQCGSINSDMSISYMTELDFIFQNDVYSVIMTPQASLLAAVPILSQMSCGFESMANTLGAWQDTGICAWKGTRLPYSASAIAKDSAQVTNMDVTVKYLARSALLGTTLKTMGPSAVCKPSFSPFYDPFQHRYQWSYPSKVATRYNVDVMRWGMFNKDNASAPSMITMTDEAAKVGDLDTTSFEIGKGQLDRAQSIVDKLPKPLNYPSREAGYMQVWEARQCCMMVFTVTNIIKMLATSFAEMNELLKTIYDVYNTVNKVYEFVNNPIGATLDSIGDGIANSLG